MLSPFQKSLMKKLEISNDSVEKLITDLTNKKNYGVHFRLLQLYIKLGLKVTKIHNDLSYHQVACLNGYIEDNSKLRAEAKKMKNGFMADLMKLKNNSVFGKQMENVRNRVNIELVNNNPQRLMKVISHPSY